MTRDEIASEITNVSFTERAFGSGYDRESVDTFLDLLRRAVVRGDSVEDLRSLVDRARFKIRWGAYNEADLPPPPRQVNAAFVLELSVTTARSRTNAAFRGLGCGEGSRRPAGA